MPLFPLLYRHYFFRKSLYTFVPKLFLSGPLYLTDVCMNMLVWRILDFLFCLVFLMVYVWYLFHQFLRIFSVKQTWILTYDYPYCMLVILHFRIWIVLTCTIKFIFCLILIVLLLLKQLQNSRSGLGIILLRENHTSDMMQNQIKLVSYPSKKYLCFLHCACIIVDVICSFSFLL